MVSHGRVSLRSPETTSAWSLALTFDDTAGTLAPGKGGNGAKVNIAAPPGGGILGKGGGSSNGVIMGGIANIGKPGPPPLPNRGVLTGWLGLALSVHSAGTSDEAEGAEASTGAGLTTPRRNS